MEIRNEIYGMAAQRRRDKAFGNLRTAGLSGAAGYGAYKLARPVTGLSGMALSAGEKGLAKNLLRTGKGLKFGAAGLAGAGVASALRAVQNWKKAREYQKAARA